MEKRQPITLRYVLLPALIILLCACGASQQPTAGAATPMTAPVSVPSATPRATVVVSVPLVQSAQPSQVASPTPAPGSPEPTPPTSTYRVVKVYPHDRAAFTEGLVYEDGFLYEGTGLNGQSTLRKVALETGVVVQTRAISDTYFGEGVTIFGDRIFQLTWQSHVGFIYDKASFAQVGQFQYPSEGWGLTHDGTRLIMSDGTATLHFLDPQTLQEIGTLDVRDANGPVFKLNELEYIHDEIYANVWQTDLIARISPQTGQVLGWIDLAGLLGPEDRQQPVDVLNGIAYDAAGDRLFVTGKLWPKLFEIKVIPR